MKSQNWAVEILLFVWGKKILCCWSDNLYKYIYFTYFSCKLLSCVFLFSTGGVIVGAVVQRNGFLAELGIQLPGQNYYYEDYGNYIQERYTNMYFWALYNDGQMV